MSTKLGSNNPFPSVLVNEQGSTPTSPAVGYQRLFIRSSDHHACRVNSSGTVTDIESGTSSGGGSGISDDVSFEALKRGIQGVGVVSGCAPTAQGSPNMTVAIASGVVRIGTVPTPCYVTGANATISAADATNPRIDLISINSSATIVVTAGTPAPTPLAPTLPSNSAIIAQISVPANDTTISTDQITDARIILKSSGFTEVIATADSDISSNTTPANDAELMFDMVANALYEFELSLAYSSPAGAGTPDLKYNFNGPATLTGQWTLLAYVSSTDTLNAGLGQNTLTSTQALGTAATPRVALIKGWALSTAGGTGSSGFVFQWSQNSSGVNATRRLAGSILAYRRLL